jgi:hypothetical protein
MDLGRVKAKVMKDNAWSSDRADMVLSKLGHIIVPSKDVDEIWHNNILHTKEYASDCKRFFGHFLHHAPGGELQVPQSQFDALMEGYIKVFGEKPPVAVWGKDAGDCDECHSLPCGGTLNCSYTCNGPADYQSSPEDVWGL